MKGMIYAVSPQGIIGVGRKIPWRYLGDWRRFKRVTMASTVVMGRTTFESIGKPLPGRRNIVVTSRPLAVAGVECVRSVEEALSLAGVDATPRQERGVHQADVWFIGGARIYEDAMKYVDVIDVTYVPDYVDGWDAVHAPPIDDADFEAGAVLDHEDEPALKRRVFTRRRP